jgi:hypothetical protein
MTTPIEQLRTKLVNERKYVEQLITVGVEEGHFLSLHGMATSDQLSSRKKTLSDIIEMIDDIQTHKGKTNGNAHTG